MLTFFKHFSSSVSRRTIVKKDQHTLMPFNKHMLGSSLGISTEAVCQECETPPSSVVPISFPPMGAGTHGAVKRQWLWTAPTTPPFNLMFSASVKTASSLMPYMVPPMQAEILTRIKHENHALTMHVHLISNYSEAWLF